MKLRTVGVAVVAIGFVAVACTSNDGDGSAQAGTDAATTSLSSDGSSSPSSTDAASPSTTDSGPTTTAEVATTTTIAELPIRPGAQRLHFEVGPIDVRPGQNNIDFTRGIPQPEADGWITRMRPDLRFADGTVPPVDVIHLHHGVWLNTSRHDSTSALPERLMAAGEEKTISAFPAPYAYRYDHTDKWTLNFMLHNLTATAKQVWITYDLDFIAADAPEAKGAIAVRPIWMDVENGKVYPVFDVIKGTGHDGLFTYPDDVPDAYSGRSVANQWTVDRDGVLVATAGHLHPGGLHTDLFDSRSGQKARLFESAANYYEPAGAVSWDVSMTATQPDWAVAVKAGDVLTVSATYDSSRASWYESMGIMVVWMADAATGNPGGTDPFTAAVDGPGMLTHGHLAENDNHGGQASNGEFADLTNAPSEPATGDVTIEDFSYSQGDMGLATSVPTVAPGGTLTFDNIDAPLENGIWHTITSCKAPCDASTGIAYPLADADIPFDSGELGVAGPPTAGRVTWTIPSNLPVGTYTYFCRIHPLMRGAFRVADPAG